MGRAVGLAALLIAGCGGGPGGEPDGAAPPDLADGDARAAANAACEAALDDEWAARPPSVGLASAATAAAYDRVMEPLLADFDVPGGAVAVIDRGRLVFAKGWGFADVDAPALAHPDDLYRIASLSKQVTAAEVLALVDAGRLSLDDHPFEILADLAPAPGKQRR